MPACQFCRGELPAPAATGRPRRFCSQACRQRTYVTKAWRTVIEAPADDDPCAICGKWLGPRYEMDHIIPVSRGGSGDPSNLQWVHPACNRSKGDKVFVPHQIWECGLCDYQQVTDLNVQAMAHPCPERGGCMTTMDRA